MNRIPNKVFQNMTKEEHSKLTMLSFTGVMKTESDGSTTIMMSSKSFKALTDYEDKMIEKYERSTRSN